MFREFMVFCKKDAISEITYIYIYYIFIFVSKYVSCNTTDMLRSKQHCNEAEKMRCMQGLIKVSMI